MGQYTNKGLYLGYDKNHKERDALDYYATPTQEVTNILEELGLDFHCAHILEPYAGGGHMIQGIKDYCKNHEMYAGINASDVQKRPLINDDIAIVTGLEYDFLSDDYPFTDDVDYVIMNPPFKTIEPFTMKALEIANKGVIEFARLQFLEGEKRFNNIFQLCPPTDVYVYVDRIACYKNGDMSIKADSAQAYAWFYWDKVYPTESTFVHWLRRVDKKG